MSRFVQMTMSDIRGGRESWRVLITISTPAFVIAVCAALLRAAF
jgi:hypothetical protein